MKRKKMKNFTTAYLLPTIAVLVLTVQSVKGADISNAGMFLFGIFLTLFLIEIGGVKIRSWD